MKFFLSSLARRGPDGSGFAQYKTAFLGMTRLAVIGVSSPPGPYSNEGNLIHTVVNGEIYNERELRIELERRGHIFATDVDSEVVVHLYEEYGEDFISRLNGIFALLLLDERKDILYAARDRLGIKPLHWREIGGRILYSSTARSLADLPRCSASVAAEGVLETLWRQSILPPHTAFNGVSSVLPGALEKVCLRDGGYGRIAERYWQPSRFNAGLGSAPDLESLAGVLDSAVMRQQRAERNSLLALSGGIDSSILAGFRCCDKSICVEMPALCSVPSEISAASKVAELFGIRLTALPFPNDVDELVRDFVAMSDRPPADGFNIFLVCRLLPKNTPVLFSGTGGDELFHGYLEITKKVMAGPTDKTLDNYLNCTAALAPATLGELAGKNKIELASFKLDFRQRIAGLIENLETYPAGEALRLLNLYLYLSSCLLQDADAYSMGQGIELRVPLLDNAIIDLALNCDHMVLVSADLSKNKLPLRRILQILSGGADLWERKQGFVLPYERLAPGAIGSSANVAYPRWLTRLSRLWLEQFNLSWNY